jgi:S1-C subfamily serine protease
VLRDEVDDIAILEVNDATAPLPPALPLAHSAARLGSSVFTLGFPRLDVMGRTPKLSEGVISGANGLFDDPGSYQTTVPIQPGNSGGPLLNMRGEVVGVMKSMLGIRDEGSDRFYLLPNTSYAVKISTVKQLLHLLPAKGAPLAELPIRLDTLEALADRVQDSVLIVTTQ